MQKKLTRILDDEKREKFFAILRAQNFSVERKENMQPTTYEIYTLPYIRMERHYAPCAYLQGNTLELTYLNLEEFKQRKSHEIVADIFKNKI